MLHRPANVVLVPQVGSQGLHHDSVTLTERNLRRWASAPNGDDSNTSSSSSARLVNLHSPPASKRLGVHYIPKQENKKKARKKSVYIYIYRCRHRPTWIYTPATPGLAGPAPMWPPTIGAAHARQMGQCSKKPALKPTSQGVLWDVVPSALDERPRLWGAHWSSWLGTDWTPRCGHAMSPFILLCSRALLLQK